MYDSNAKISAGILSGNVNQFGDFDECLSSRNEEEDIGGKYCLASMQIESSDSPYLSAIHDLVHSHSPFKSNLKDVRN